MVTLKQQLYAWRTVVFALFLRELQSKFNDKFGLSWAFFEPFVFIFALSFFRGLIRDGDVYGISLFHFMMIGLVGLQSYTTGIQSVSTSIRKNKPLYAFRQVQPMSAVITYGFLEAFIKVIVIGLLVLALYLLGDGISVDNYLLLFTLFALLWIQCISVGLMFGIVAAFIPEIDKVKSMLMRPLLFISCVFFSLKDVPEQYWPYLTWNPIVHFVELARFACFPDYGREGVSLAYATETTIGTLFLALCLYHITWKKVLAR